MLGMPLQQKLPEAVVYHRRKTSKIEAGHCTRSGSVRGPTPVAKSRADSPGKRHPHNLQVHGHHCIHQLSLWPHLCSPAQILVLCQNCSSKTGIWAICCCTQHSNKTLSLRQLPFCGHRIHIHHWIFAADDLFLQHRCTSSEWHCQAVHLRHHWECTHSLASNLPPMSQGSDNKPLATGT